jgi:hypothetical protein
MLLSYGHVSISFKQKKTFDGLPIDNIRISQSLIATVTMSFYIEIIVMYIKSTSGQKDNIELFSHPVKY